MNLIVHALSIKKKHIYIYVLYTLKKLKIKEIHYHRYNTGKLFVPMNMFVLKNKVKNHYLKGNSSKFA
jgi:hypothetical protein